MSAPVNIRRFCFVSGNRWCLTEVAVESFAARVRKVEVYDCGRASAGDEEDRACVRDVCEEDRENLSAAGGDTSAVIGSA